MNVDTDKYSYVSFNISFVRTPIYKSISFLMFLGPLLNVWCLYSEVFWQLLSVACWQHADIWGYQSYRVTKFPTRPLSPLIQHSPAPGSVKQCQEREDNWEGKSLGESSKILYEVFGFTWNYLKSSNLYLNFNVLKTSCSVLLLSLSHIHTYIALVLINIKLGIKRRRKSEETYDEIAHKTYRNDHIHALHFQF